MLSIFWCIFLLFIWFKTDAFVNYGKLLGFSDKFKISDWEDYRILNPKISYLEYIFLKNRNFLTKIISCVPCFLFWIAILVSLVLNSLFYYPITYILSYVFYKLIDKYV